MNEEDYVRGTADETNRIKGVVAWFDIGICYGFIVSGDTRYYVNCRMLSDSYIVALKKHQKVSFIPKQGKKGMFVTHIKLIKNN